MSNRAEEKALEAYPPEMRKAFELLPKDWNKPLRTAYVKGYKQAEKDLGWNSVDKSLPPVDEEVIVLRNESNGITLPYPYNLSYGHLVADKTIFVEYNGWNVPGVKYWMPMPKIPKEDE